jgi:hypothetical protein
MASNRQRASMNRCPKVTDNRIATKWAPIRHRLNAHFQALAVLRYDGRDMHLMRATACPTCPAMQARDLCGPFRVPLPSESIRRSDRRSAAHYSASAAAAQAWPLAPGTLGGAIRVHPSPSESIRVHPSPSVSIRVHPSQSKPF